MRAVWITSADGPDGLRVRESPDPVPGPGQVRIRVRAAGLNFAEVMAAQGLYPDAPKRPCVVGYEVAGVIDAGGEGVDGPAPGTRVIALTHFGGHSDVVCVPVQQVIEIPEGKDFAAAAALPVNYLTAYHMVFGTASAVKHERLRAEGCAHPIDYRTTDYAAEVRRLTGGEGVDAALDPLGGADSRKGLKLLRPCGRLVVYGFANLTSGPRRRPLHMLSSVAGIPLLTPLQLMNANRTVGGVNIGHLWGRLDVLRGELEELIALWAAGTIEPVIDSSYPFAEAAAAHRRILERRNTGKIILTP